MKKGMKNKSKQYMYAYANITKCIKNLLNTIIKLI